MARRSKGWIRAFALLFAALFALLILGLIPSQRSLETQAAADQIRRIARTPTVEFFEDSGQPPEIVVYMPGITSSQSSRYIARAAIMPHTEAFETSFETEVPAGQVWGKTKKMGIDAFAREVERRAQEIDRLTRDALAASRGEPYDKRFFVVSAAPPCKRGGSDCFSHERQWNDGVRPKNIWAITSDGKLVTATAAAVAKIAGSR